MKTTLQTSVYGTILLLLTGLFQQVAAQVSITSIGSSYTQDFNSLPTSGTSWTDNSTLTNWYADRSSGNSAIPYANDDGSSADDGIYSYGSSTDRALGALPANPGVGNLSIGVRMKNNSGSAINAFTISFAGEQWRVNGTGSQSIQFFYRTSTSTITSVTSGSWTSVSSLNFTSPITGTSGAINGNESTNKSVKTFTVTGITLASGSEIMFKWYFPKLANVDHGYSIDDLTITAESVNVYYSKSSGALNLLSTWGTATDGSGTNPSNFTGASTYYIIANNSTPTLSDNWTVSGSGSKVILGTGSSINFTIPSSYTLTGAIDLTSSSTLTINNTTSPTIGSIGSGSVVVFSASGNYSIPAATYQNLTVNTSGTVSITGATTVGGTLTLTSGNLSLGNNNLTIAANASISGGSSSSYIVADGAGSLIRNVKNNATGVVFPVGTSTAYIPATLSQTAAGTADNFYVRVLGGAYTEYNASDVPTGSLITSHVVTKTWVVSEGVSGGSNLSLTLQWNASDEGTSFSRTSASVLHYTNGDWTAGSYGTSSGSGPYTRQITGITSFSPFSVGDNLGALPVEWLSFRALDKGNRVELNWATASEKNNQGFAVERRTAADNDFVQIGFVNGNGTSALVHTYTFADAAAPAGDCYYRLKQVDFNGEYAYSSIELVKRSQLAGKVNDLSVYPNPSRGAISVSCSGDDGEALLQVSDLSGRVVMEREVTGMNSRIQADEQLHLAAGTYLVAITQGENRKYTKLVIQ